MIEKEVQKFAVNLAVKFKEESVDITETPMSWIVLTKSQAFKIKKPIKNQWFDYSNLESRKISCEAEVEMNQWLAPNVYLGVIPIVDTLFPANGESYESVIEYAVLMKKLRVAKQMNRMLDRKEVNKEHILKLVRCVVRYHSHSKVVDMPPINTYFQEMWHKVIRFDYSESIDELISSAQTLKHADSIFKSFYRNHQTYFKDRKDFGKVRELHGNLLCNNIYLYNKPLIVDCIEFSDTLKHVDVLNEAALLCMDLEAHGERYLSGYFYKEYKKRMGTVNEECDEFLFVIYKLYHALAKAHENILKAVAHKNKSQYYSYAAELTIYSNLIDSYVEWLSRAST